MNMYVYGYGPKGRERLIVVDAGVLFPDPETTPGVDLIIPDYSWLVERKDQVEGIVLTHGHEDHIGAVPFVLEELPIPVFATPFPAELTRRKLDEFELDPGSVREVNQYPSTISIGPFSIQFIPVPHSIPEASALLIEAGESRIVHSGDLKLDSDPVIGRPFDRELWSEAMAQGITALVCDSTNVFSTHPGRSEASVGPRLAELFAETKGTIAATTFASNIARLKQIADAGHRSGREIVLLGRAMLRMVEVGLKTGVLSSFPRTISAGEATRLPRDKLLMLATGSQGEPRSATSQLANGKFCGLELAAGDTLLYSSKTIPGNERSIARVVNRFAERGVRVIEDPTEIYHVSGHLNQPDLLELYRIVKPDTVVPMHGEHRHLIEHERLAESVGIPAHVIANGMSFEFGSMRRNPEFALAGRLYLDGNELIEPHAGVVRQRLRMSRAGLACVSVVLDRRSRKLRKLEMRLMGVPGEDDLIDDSEVSRLVEDEILNGGRRRKGLEGDMESRVGKRVRRHVASVTGKSPEVSVIIHQV